MDTPSSLADVPLSQAAAALEARQCSPVELTDDYLTRIDELDPRLNAYVEITRQRAKDDAARAADEIAKGGYRAPYTASRSRSRTSLTRRAFAPDLGPRCTGTASRRAMRPWCGGRRMPARSCSASTTSTSWRSG
jgi:hypothetical protein